MSMSNVPTNAKAGAIHILVTHADGTQTDHGVVSHYHADPHKQSVLDKLRAAGQHITHADVFGVEPVDTAGGEPADSTTQEG